MTKDQLESKMNLLVNRLDSMIDSLLAIKNYKYDSMCTTFLKTLDEKRADICLKWEKLLNGSINLSTFNLDEYYNEQNQLLDRLNETLKSLQSRPPIKPRITPHASANIQKRLSKTILLELQMFTSWSLQVFLQKTVLQPISFRQKKLLLI